VESTSSGGSRGWRRRSSCSSGSCSGSGDGGGGSDTRPSSILATPPT